MVVKGVTHLGKGDEEPRDVTRTLIGECLFIYSCSARRIFFEFELISKEIPPHTHTIIAQVASLEESCQKLF